MQEDIEQLWESQKDEPLMLTTEESAGANEVMKGKEGGELGRLVGRNRPHSDFSFFLNVLQNTNLSRNRRTPQNAQIRTFLARYVRVGNTVGSTPFNWHRKEDGMSSSCELSGLEPSSSRRMPIVFCRNGDYGKQK